MRGYPTNLVGVGGGSNTQRTACGTGPRCTRGLGLGAWYAALVPHRYREHHLRHDALAQALASRPRPPISSLLLLQLAGLTCTAQWPSQPGTSEGINGRHLQQGASNQEGQIDGIPVQVINFSSKLLQPREVSVDDDTNDSLQRLT